VLTQEPRNTCPFTKQPVRPESNCFFFFEAVLTRDEQIHKRDLVLLTWDNIEQYRDKIIDLSGQSTHKNPAPRPTKAKSPVKRAAANKARLFFVEVFWSERPQRARKEEDAAEEEEQASPEL
jgi:hypothetical protein